jgi:hypothetical protein
MRTKMMEVIQMKIRLKKRMTILMRKIWKMMLVRMMMMRMRKMVEVMMRKNKMRMDDLL